MSLPQTRASSTDWLNEKDNFNDDNMSFDNDDEFSDMQLDEVTEADMNQQEYSTPSDNEGPQAIENVADTLDESDDMFMNQPEDIVDTDTKTSIHSDDDSKDLIDLIDNEDEQNEDIQKDESINELLLDGPNEDQSMDALLSDEQHDEPTQSEDMETLEPTQPEDMETLEPTQSEDMETLEPTSSSTGPSLFERIRHFLTDSIPSGIQHSNQADTDMVQTISSSTHHIQSYTITYFVMKLLLLACVIGYTASIDVRMCPCANNFRKPMILIGGGIVMILCLLAMVLPRLFTWMPFLKAFLMTLTFVVLYCIITYFPLLRNSDCECSEQDWRRWVVEGIVYITIALFVLTLLGVVSI